MTEGLVIKQEANFYTVAEGEEVFLCTMRANIKKAGEQIKVGDRVLLDETDAERPVIVDMLPRSSELQKPAVANVDQVLIVMSCLQPDFNFLLVDRLILAVLYENLQPILCVSKSDLLDEELAEYLAAEYDEFPLYFVSAATGRGVDELLKALEGKVTVLAGTSGTGKSSLINLLSPEVRLVVGEVNQIGIGKHTTRHVSLHRIGRKGCSGWVADSPGFNNMQLPPIEAGDLCTFYPEFAPFLGHCGFSDCQHWHEDNCAVKAGLTDEDDEDNEPESERYFNYLRIFDELREAARERNDSGKEESLTKRAVGKNRRDQVLKLGTAGRARSRRTHRQIIEQVGNWAEVDEEMLDDVDPEEWRI